MAGDKVSAMVQYYFSDWTTGNNNTFVNAILNSLGSAISNGGAAGSLVKNNAAQITSQLSGINGFIDAVQPSGNNPDSYPEAYLTILFFDERFNFIEAADGGVAQEQINKEGTRPDGAVLVLPDIKAPKNGYAFIYISNLSDDAVYFDNFKVGIVQGNIAEENHYYAYGLKIATLSSKKLGDDYEGSLKNNYLNQGAYSELDDDIGWNDFALRNYDPQIGRFPQLDPLTDSYPFLTPYQYASCDPITNIDVDGLEGCPSVAGMTGYVGNVGRVAGSAGNIFNGISAIARIASPIIASLNLAVNVVNTNTQQNIIAHQIATNIINNDFTTSQAGEDPIKNAIDKGKKSATFASLLKKAGVTNSNYKEIISLGDETGITSKKVNGLPAIQLDKNESKDENIISLAHELTNRKNGNKFY